MMWTDEELNRICERCGKRFGEHAVWMHKHLCDPLNVVKEFKEKGVAAAGMAPDYEAEIEKKDLSDKSELMKKCTAQSCDAMKGCCNYSPGTGKCADATIMKPDWIVCQYFPR